MVALSRKYLREPRSVEDFSKFDSQLKLLDGIDSLGIGSDHFRFRPKEFIGEICRTMKRNQGKKVHFLLPMTGQQGTGEFLKGVLHVLFADREVGFSFLKTPYRVNLNLFEDMPHLYQKYDDILGKNIAASLKAHNSSTADTEFVVIDRHGSGTTQRAINRHLKTLADFWDPSHCGAGLEDCEFHMTQDKSADGEISPSRGHLLEFILGQDPENPKLSKEDFTRNGYTLINWLKSNSSRFFSHDEQKAIVDLDFDLYDKSKASKDGWPNIINHIRALPPKKQKEIIKRLKYEDNMVAKMAYQYGIAHAKDYQREHGSK